MSDTYHAGWLALIVALGACGEGGSPSSNPDAGPSASARASAAPTATARLAARLEILKLVLTSNVKQREAVDTLTTARAGDRVYAHVKVRNRTGEHRRLSLTFLVNEEQRSTVDLGVDVSWSYRTWGYCTLRKADKGTLHVEVRATGGTLLEEASLPIGKAR